MRPSPKLVNLNEGDIMKKRNASTAGAALVMTAAVVFLCAGCGNHEAVMEERQTRAQPCMIRIPAEAVVA